MSADEDSQKHHHDDGASGDHQRDHEHGRFAVSGGHDHQQIELVFEDQRHGQAWFLARPLSVAQSTKIVKNILRAFDPWAVAVRPVEGRSVRRNT
ncbi:unnamed protein product [Sphagnum jensenii]|uniref:Uncharacterized protein n=1 Tax=Sphagnum jensenii TaxID=128206 RepID=A0ABP0WTJ1_9BRYO